MKEVGMNMLIFNWTADSTARETIHPTGLSGYRQKPGFTDELERCLRLAEANDIQVFVGLNFSADWWSKGVQAPDWLLARMREGNALADELYALYGKRFPRAFHGWYWVWEIHNSSSLTATNSRVVVARALDTNIRHLHALNRSLPVMFSPFMNSTAGDAQTYAAFWMEVFRQTDLGKGDIFAPQDGIGAGHLSLDQVADWFARLAVAVKTKPGLRLWANIETFTQEDWTPAPLGRIVRQRLALQPFVEDFVTFSYNHYQSPHHVYPRFHAAWADYFRTGQLRRSQPRKPESPILQRKPDGTIRLTWKVSKDGENICGYTVYRNGARIGHRQVSRSGWGVVPDAVEFAVRDSVKTADSEYAIEAYDFWGNLSPKTTVRFHAGLIP